MKKLTLTLSFILVVLALVAQVPQAFKYQAVVRDNSGEILTNQSVSFRIGIHDGSAGGTIVYQETHTILTNEFGLANLEIGNGTPVTGDFSTINWAINNKFLEIELDPAGGSSYVSMGTTQLLSVPYALYSENTANTDDNDWVKSGNYIYTLSDSVGIGTNTPSSKLEVAGHIWQTSLGNSIFIGENAGLNDDLTNNWNVAIGYEALKTNQIGNFNIAIGARALTNNLTNANVAVGNDALTNNTSGQHNIAVGGDALEKNTTGNNNVALGYTANFFNQEGNNNTMVGYGAGGGSTQLHSSSGNVFLGYLAGYYEYGNNKLIIENSLADANNALIYGEFDNDILAFNASVGIGTINPSADLDVNGIVQMNGFKMPTGATDGYVLISDANGIGSWALPSSINDGDWVVSGNDLYSAVSGNIGVGTTNPGAKLDVRSASPISGIFVESIGGWAIQANSYTSGGVCFAGLTNGGTAFEAEAAGIGTAKLCSTADNAAGYFSGDVLIENGYLGIGTTNPGAKLDIRSSTSTACLFAENSAGWAIQANSYTSGGVCFAG
nr:hypothetical protein [Bacteroidota bacterium]